MELASRTSKDRQRKEKSVIRHRKVSSVAQMRSSSKRKKRMTMRAWSTVDSRPISATESRIGRQASKKYKNRNKLIQMVNLSSIKPPRLITMMLLIEQVKDRDSINNRISKGGKSVPSKKWKKSKNQARA